MADEVRKAELAYDGAWIRESILPSASGRQADGRGERSMFSLTNIYRLRGDGVAPVIIWDGAIIFRDD